MSGAARDDMLARIRAAHGGHETETPIMRQYRRQGNASKEEVLGRFLERLHDYGVVTRRVAGDLAEAITAALKARGAHRLVISADYPAAWCPPDFTWLRDEGLSYDDLDSSDGVVTGCAVAIAETGTIVLDGGRTQGRRVLSLLPDYHLCIIDAAQVVELVPEAVVILDDAIKAGRPLTFISGPSATSDIELTRVEGVHGPRRLEVLLVGAHEVV